MRTRVEITNDFLAINAAPGDSFQVIAEKSGSGIPFGCRNCQCSTCITDVLLGEEYLNEKDDSEKSVLSGITGTRANTRLACKMKIAKPNGIVRIKY